MPEENERHWKFRVMYERSAGVGKTDGFKVESSSDDRNQAEHDAYMLYLKAIETVKSNMPVVKETPGKAEKKEG